MTRGFRDRDYVETPERLLFCVLGNVHPPSRIIAYLKYVPAARGRWRRRPDGMRYERALPSYGARAVELVMRELERRHPEYVVDDPVLKIRMIEIPRERVISHHRPEERLASMLKHGPEDALEALALELVDLLAEELGVPRTAFGVTGSILLRMHDPQLSDIDLVVYGADGAKALRDKLPRLLGGRVGGLSRPEGSLLREWALRISSTFALSPEEAARLCRERWQRALFKGRPFSVHPVKLEHEVGERYGDRVVRRVLGIITLRAVVEDASDAIFMPAVYRVGGVRVLEGPEVMVREVVSYEGLFAGIAGEGETIVARGKVEEVLDRRSGETYYRVIIGSFEARGEDFIKPLRWLRS